MQITIAIFSNPQQIICPSQKCEIGQIEIEELKVAQPSTVHIPSNSEHF